MTNRRTPEYPRPKRQPIISGRELVIGVGLGTVIFFTSYMVGLYSDGSSEFDSLASPLVAAAAEFCYKERTAFFYEAQWGDTLKGIAEATGLSNPLLPFDPDTITWLNPAFKEARELDNIYWGEVLALPPVKSVLEWAATNDIPRFPDHPKQGTLQWFFENDLATHASLIARGQIVAQALNATENQDFSSVLRDICITIGYRQDRSPFTPEVAAEILADYEYHVERNPYLVDMLQRYAPQKIREINQLLKSSGVSWQLPEDLYRHTVFLPQYNDIGGGTVFGSYFLIIDGNYQWFDKLTEEMGRDVGNTLMQTYPHEGHHGWIQSPNFDYNDLPRPQAEFAHASIGLVTLPIEDIQAEGFSPAQAVDPRVAYVYYILTVRGGMSPVDAYTSIVRAASYGVGIDAIVDRFNSQLHISETRFEKFFNENSLAGNPPNSIDSYYRANDLSIGEFMFTFDELRKVMEFLKAPTHDMPQGRLTKKSRGLGLIMPPQQLNHLGSDRFITKGGHTLYPPVKHIPSKPVTSGRSYFS